MNHNKYMIIRFLIYGLVGWGIEIIWTGFFSAFSGDRRFIGHTYLWMLPIYGTAVLFEPIHQMIVSWPMILRGGIWVVLIYVLEYSSGWLIRTTIGECPWNYGNVKYAVNGLIRLDYAPAWFVAGLVFERVHIFLNSVL